MWRQQIRWPLFFVSSFFSLLLLFVVVHLFIILFSCYFRHANFYQFVICLKKFCFVWFFFIFLAGICRLVTSFDIKQLKCTWLYANKRRDETMTLRLYKRQLLNEIVHVDLLKWNWKDNFFLLKQIIRLEEKQTHFYSTKD